MGSISEDKYVFGLTVHQERQLIWQKYLFSKTIMLLRRGFCPHVMPKCIISKPTAFGLLLKRLLYHLHKSNFQLHFILLLYFCLQEPFCPPRPSLPEQTVASSDYARDLNVLFNVSVGGITGAL